MWKEARLFIFSFFYLKTPFKSFFIIKYLAKYLKMSEKALLEGIKADKFAFKMLLDSPEMLKKHLGVDSA